MSVQIIIYLIQALGSIALLIFLVRLLLQLCRVNFYNPISQFVFKTTQPVLAPVRKVIPTYRTFDSASLVMAIFVQWLMIQLILTVAGVGLMLTPLSLGWAALGTLSTLLNIYFYGLLAVIILSWVAPGNRHPMAELLSDLMEPVMAPFRRVVPSLGGLDLSPILVFLTINVLRIFVGHLAVAMQLPRGAVAGI